MDVNIFAELINTVVDFNDDVFRNIPTIIASEDLLDDLSDNPEDRAYGEVIVSEQAYAGNYDDPVIMRPFTYGMSLRSNGYARIPTRFSSGERFAVWYGSLELTTTIHETLYHWKKRIADMMTEIREEILSERRIFRVAVNGVLIDLRGKHRAFPGLVDPVDYAFTNNVGAYLFDKGQKGLLAKSARCDDGVNVAVFSPDILKNPRHHSYLVYRWTPGAPETRVESADGAIIELL